MTDDILVYCRCVINWSCTSHVAYVHFTTNNWHLRVFKPGSGFADNNLFSCIPYWISICYGGSNRLDYNYKSASNQYFDIRKYWHEIYSIGLAPKMCIILYFVKSTLYSVHFSWEFLMIVTEFCFEEHDKRHGFRKPTCQTHWKLVLILKSLLRCDLQSIGGPFVAYTSILVHFHILFWEYCMRWTRNYNILFTPFVPYKVE